jgi:hypothetical protein
VLKRADLRHECLSRFHFQFGVELVLIEFRFDVLGRLIIEAFLCDVPLVMELDDARRG